MRTDSEWIRNNCPWNRVGSLAVAVMMVSLLGAAPAAFGPDPESGDEVEALVKGLERDLSKPGADRALVEQAVGHLEALLDKADAGQFELSDGLRFKARIMISRAEVRRLQRKPNSEGTRDISEVHLGAAPGEKDEVGSPTLVRTLRRKPVEVTAGTLASAIDEKKSEAPPTERVIARLDKSSEDALSKPPEVGEVKVKQAPVTGDHFVFAWPIKKVRVTSRFGMRKHPKLKRRKMHKGTDLGGARGTAVHATGPGRVVRAGKSGGGVGIQVVIEHPGGWVSRYFHLSKVEIKEGATVKRGELIGRVGSTGRSTGPHLHFQVEHKGRALNPEKLVGRRSDKTRPK